MASMLEKMKTFQFTSNSVWNNEKIRKYGMYSLAAIGGYYVLKTSFNIISRISKHTIRQEYDLLDRYGNKSDKYNKSWVIITGATAGIGYSYCKAMAKRGFNILVISRNKEKISRLTNDLNILYPNIKIKSIECDLGLLYDYINYDNNSGNIAQFEKNLTNIISENEMDIAILINNAGILTKGIPFNSSSLSNNINAIVVNIFAPLILTQILIPHFIKRFQKNNNQRSCVINIGSMGGNIPLPGLSIYSGSKAFLTNFSIGISKELEENNIDVICLNPSGISSNMVPVEPDGYVIIESDVFVESSMKHIGKEREHGGFWAHCLSQYIISQLPKEMWLRFHLNFLKQQLRARL